MRVFVSSIVNGYEDFRQAAKDAIEALRYEVIAMERTEPASSSSTREACLDTVESSDVIVLLIGRRYGRPTRSGGMSAT